MEQKKNREIIPIFGNVVSVENLKKIITGYFIKDKLPIIKRKSCHIPDAEDWAVVGRTY